MCRSWRFGFLCIRLIIFLTQLPFTKLGLGNPVLKLDADFTYNGTKGSVCTMDCFNRHFHKPLVMAWDFIFVLVILSVFLMELLTSHLRSVLQKGASKNKEIVYLHKNRSALGLLYLLSIALRTVVETWFLYVLLSWNLPALNSDPHSCPTNLCSELNFVYEGRHGSTLSSISAMIIICSVLFCSYSITHYLCNFSV
ncbi:LOW QUALITY PROTEIN: uncharacterized protein gjz1 [Pholidichthys leucotaenia]